MLAKIIVDKELTSPPRYQALAMDKLSRAFRNAFSSIKRAVQSKEMVGTDELGNKYYRYC